ncbi:hypothetical protein CDIK_2503 [Cucumispora dikerogammari]|nr:hypothetical protein CDIK_2503 [Cucumispora dikerogammari]
MSSDTERKKKQLMFLLNLIRQPKDYIYNYISNKLKRSRSKCNQKFLIPINDLLTSNIFENLKNYSNYKNVDIEDFKSNENRTGNLALITLFEIKSLNEKEKNLLS